MMDRDVIAQRLACETGMMAMKARADIALAEAPWRPGLLYRFLRWSGL